MVSSFQAEISLHQDRRNFPTRGVELLLAVLSYVAVRRKGVAVRPKEQVRDGLSRQGPISFPQVAPVATLRRTP